MEWGAQMERYPTQMRTPNAYLEPRFRTVKVPTLHSCQVQSLSVNVPFVGVAAAAAALAAVLLSS